MIAALNPAELGQASSQTIPPANLKLRAAAAEFEAMLLSKWWSTMRESGFGGFDETDAGHDTLDQLGMESLSGAVARAGGIGLGKLLVRGLQFNVEIGKKDFGT